MQPSKIEFFSGKQPVKAAHECPENIEYYFSDKELNKPVKRLWIGSGEDGNLYSDYNGHLYNEVSCGEN